MDAQLLATATIGKTYGLEGYLKVLSLSGKVSHLESLKECVLELSDGKRAAVAVSSSKTQGNLFLMRFKGYETPEKARALSGSVMYVDRKDAAPLRDGEYYVADLYGLALMSDGVEVGRIDAVCDGAQADYLLTKRKDGKSVLIPNMEPFVSKPDFEKGVVELLMPSLLEQ